MTTFPFPHLTSPDDFSHLLPNDRTYFTVRETAEVLGCSDQYVRDCFDQGKLHGQWANGRSDVGRERRRRVRISRESILLYLAANATNDPATIAARLHEVMARLPHTWRQKLLAQWTHPAPSA